MDSSVLIIMFCCGTSARDSKAHVFITAGQSNTDGRVRNIDLPDYIKIHSTDTVNYTSGEYPYCRIIQNSTDGKFKPFWPKGRLKDGLWAYDAVTYKMIENALNEPFYVIKWAVGGTSIALPVDTVRGKYWSADKEWLKNTCSTAKKGKSLLLSFTEAIDAAIDSTLSKLPQGYHIDAFIWHQGESDSKYHPDDYYKNLNNVINHVREHLTMKTGENYMDLPFVFGTVAKSNKQYSEKVETAMHRIADEDPNARLIDMSCAELQKDKLHFTAKSAEYLGKEVWRELDRILDLNHHGFRVARYKDNRKAAVSYTFDDGLIEQYTRVAPFIDSLGLKATFFINGARINGENMNNDSTRGTWKQLKEMARNGQEISNHGWKHRNFAKFSIDEIKEDIMKNDSAILANIGIPAITFCYPNNNKKKEGRLIAETNRVGTRTYQRSIGGKSTPEDLRKWLDFLVATRKWGVGMTHGITQGYDHFSDPNILWNHLKDVKKRDNEIWIATFKDIASYTREQQKIEYDIEKNDNKIIITFKLDLDPNLFTQQLTGILEMQKVKSIRQGNTVLSFKHDGDSILFNFNPFGRPIEILY